MYPQNVPFSAYQRVFSASTEIKAMENLASLQRSYGPITKHALNPLVLVYLAHAPRMRETALQLLQSHSTKIRSLHLVLTPHCQFTVLCTGDASNVAWAYQDAQRALYVHGTKEGVVSEQGAIADLVYAQPGTLASAMATAMTLSEKLRQAAMLYFASAQQALQCSSLGHLDAKFLKWARKFPVLEPLLPREELPLPPPPPVAVVANSAGPSYARPRGDSPIVPASLRAAPSVASVAQEQVAQRIAKLHEAQRPPSQHKATLRKRQQKVRESLGGSGLIVLRSSSSSKRPAAAAIRPAATRGSKRLKSTFDRNLRRQLNVDLNGSSSEPDEISQIDQMLSQRTDDQMLSQRTDEDTDMMAALLAQNDKQLQAEKAQAEKAQAEKAQKYLLHESITEEELLRIYEEKVRRIQQKQRQEDEEKVRRIEQKQRQEALRRINQRK